jgi:tetratricopeptide (TPR) repeat protein
MYLRVGIAGVKRNYAEAEKLFRSVKEIAAENDDLARALDATLGLLDLARTGMRDEVNEYQPEGVGERTEQNFLELALTFKEQAKELMTRINDEYLESLNPEDHIKAQLMIAKAYTQFALIEKGFAGIADKEKNENEKTNYLKAALEYDNQAVEVLEELNKAHPNNPEIENRLARALTTRGVTSEDLGDLAEAVEDQEKSLAIYLEAEREDIRGVGNACISSARAREQLLLPWLKAKNPSFGLDKLHRLAVSLENYLPSTPDVIGDVDESLNLPQNCARISRLYDLALEHSIREEDGKLVVVDHDVARVIPDLFFEKKFGQRKPDQLKHKD